MASSPPDMPSPPYLGEGSGILNFKHANDESLKEAWDRLLEIQMRAKPTSHIKLLPRSFYVDLPVVHRHVLDFMFENHFLGNNAFDTYEMMKSVFGQLKVETIEPAILVSYRQTELIK